MREAVFMGEVTASITHEMQNVLAIIQQSAGLMGDFLDLSRRETMKSLGFRKGFQYHDKFRTLIGAINEQVERGTGLSEGLNRLAHVTDDQGGRSDMTRLSRLLFSLIRRIARKRRIEFVLETPETAGPVMADCPPMTALMSLYGVARAFVGALSGCTVRVWVGFRGNDPVVDFFLPEGGAGSPAIALPPGGAFDEKAGSPRLEVRKDGVGLVFSPCPSAEAGSR